MTPLNMPGTQVLVYTPQPSSPRLSYILELLLSRILGYSWRLCSDVEAYRQAAGMGLNYSDTRIREQEVWIRPCGLLAQVGIIQAQQPEPFTHEPGSLPAIFPDRQQPKASFDFDLLAASFYFVSRYEEYLPFSPDKLGRFPAQESLAFRAGWLQVPVVQLWAHALGQALSRSLGLPPPPKPPYQFLPTYDIDIPWAYSLRGWRGALRTAADLLGGKGQLTRQRLAVLRGHQADPYDTFAFLDGLHQGLQVQPIYFFLLAARGPFDPGAPPTHPRLQALVRRLSQTYAIGIHPSWRSNEQPGLLDTEIGYLQQATGQTVVRSRQHFLRLHFPHTYRHLLAAGIQHDFSLGFADAPGFRAGIALPFHWYDLPLEQPTSLLLTPLSCMDASFKTYLQLGPDEAFAQVQQLSDTLRLHGGTLVSLWHNSSFSPLHGWPLGWQQGYQNFLHQQLKYQTQPET